MCFHAVFGSVGQVPDISRCTSENSLLAAFPSCSFALVAAVHIQGFAGKGYYAAMPALD